MAIDLLKYMIWKNGTGRGGASYEKTVGPAPIISISDAKAKPAKSLVVGMEPIQDLHGYDSPWPAGGGKNKLNTTMTTVTRSGVTFTPNNDGTITASGTSINSISDITFANNIDVLPNTDYILTGCPSGGSSSTYRLNLLINGGQAVLDYGSGAAFTTPEQITSLRVYPIVLADVNMDGKVYQPMIRLATETDATYAPYENICLISGRTGVTVNHSGADTSDPQTYPVVFPDSVGTVYGGTVDLVSGVLTVEWVRIPMNSITWSYSGVRFESSRLNGADISRNVLTVMSEMYKGVPNMTGSSFNSDAPDMSMCFNAVGGYRYIMIKDSRYTDAVSFAAQLDGHYMVYALATPQTYQLTPTQIQLLKGSNTLWSNADDLTLTYLGTNPPNLLGGMLGGMLGNPQEPAEEFSEESEAEPVSEEPQE